MRARHAKRSRAERGVDLSPTLRASCPSSPSCPCPPCPRPRSHPYTGEIPPMLTDLLQHLFAASTRSKGRGYASMRRVRLHTADARAVKAVVTGTESYHVAISTRP